MTLLAVDIGVRTGLALWGGDGRLRWYRSRNFGNAARLRRAAVSILSDLPDLTHLVLEGGGPLAEIWEREARRRGVHILRVSAEQWRAVLFHPRERRSGAGAKANAGGLARRVIEWSGAPRPTSLRNDAAEAVLVGLWGALRLGWLHAVPPVLRDRV